MGINLCPAPQISEHCPTMILGRLIIRNIWLIRPGIASTLTPSDGMVYEWITSFDVTNIRVGVLIGIIKWLEDSIKRKLLFLVTIELNFNFDNSEYSYDQCHWNPIVLIDSAGFTLSSIM